MTASKVASGPRNCFDGEDGASVPGNISNVAESDAKKLHIVTKWLQNDFNTISKWLLKLF